MGKVKVTDALTEEVAIIAFDYNKHEPRVFSKFSARRDPQTYNVEIADASEASAAAPVFFDPKIIGDQILIDGAVIANNPALYAYMLSRHALHKDNIRLISIGTGTTQPSSLDSTEVTKIDWLMQVTNLLTVVEQNAHEYLLDILPGEYYRF